VLIPSTCKKSTPNHEYILRHRETGERAFVQVKTGRAVIGTRNFSSYAPDKVFFFSTTGQYVGTIDDNMETIDYPTLERFLRDHTNILPERIQRWVALLS